jgi:predicted transcriptional regulator
MTIVNRRNAVVGWAVWKSAKFVGKQRARQAVPGTGDYAGLNKSALATIAAVAAGIALVVWRTKSAESASG